MPALFQPFPMLEGRAAQVWHHQPSFRRPRHFHLEPELNVVTRGRGVLSVGDREFELRAGDAVFLQPGQDHELLAESPDFELFVLALQPELAENCEVLSARQLEAVTLSPQQIREFREAWHGLGELRDESVVQTRLCDHFRSILPKFTLSPALPRRVAHAIRHRPELAGSDLAEELHAHPSDISRSVVASFGMRLVDYRVRLRLMRFIRSVDAGLSLSRAAYASGFGSYTQCHRVFSKHLACSPRDYFDGRRRDIDGLLHESGRT
jgi:AraC-like DNA-binding protein